MKRIILLLFMFKGCVAFGQIKIIADTGLSIKNNMGNVIWLDLKWYDKSDTIPILIQYSDTSSWYVLCIKEGSVGTWTWPHSYDSCEIHDYDIHWMKGYVIPSNEYIICFDVNRKVIPCGSDYLDENKQPLKKEYIVWQVKELQ